MEFFKNLRDKKNPYSHFSELYMRIIEVQICKIT
jgi:hypothetical protein